MPDDEQRKTQTERFRRLTVRFNRSLIFNYEKTTRRAKNYARCYRHLKNFFKRLIKKAYKRPRFAVEVAALVVVSFYTVFAGIQNHLLRKSVNQQVMISRPVLVPNGVTQDGVDAIPRKVVAHLRNFGKSLAIDVLMTGEIVMAPKGPPFPVDPLCKEFSPPENLAPTTVASDNTNNYLDAWPHWTAGQNQDVTDYNRGKILYAVGCVWYRGLDDERYYTRICTYWDPKNGNSFAFCIDPDSNIIH